MEATTVATRPVLADYLGWFIAAVMVSSGLFGATLLLIVLREWGHPHLDFTRLDLMPVVLMVLQAVLVPVGVAGGLRSFGWRRYGRALVWLLLIAALLVLILAEYTGWFIAVVGVVTASDWKSWPL